MSDDTDELDFPVITIRWDRDDELVVCDLGCIDLFSGFSMLSVAIRAVDDLMAAARVIQDGQLVSDESDDDDDDEEDE